MKYVWWIYEINHVSPHPSPHSSSAKVELIGHSKTKVCKVEIKLSMLMNYNSKFIPAHQINYQFTNSLLK